MPSTMLYSGRIADKAHLIVSKRSIFTAEIVIVVLLILEKRLSKKTQYNGSPLVSSLQELTCCMGSHSVTCQPAKVYIPALTYLLARFSNPEGTQG